MKHSPEEWKEIIKEYKESGLSQIKTSRILTKKSYKYP